MSATTGLTWLPNCKLMQQISAQLNDEIEDTKSKWCHMKLYHCTFPWPFLKKIIHVRTKKVCHFAKANYTVCQKHFILATMATMAELPHGKSFFPVADISVVETRLSFPLE